MFLPAHQSNFCQRYSSSFARNPDYRLGILITCVTIKLIDWIVFHAKSEIFQLYNGGKETLTKSLTAFHKKLPKLSLVFLINNK